jgi:hypothetical protein
VSAAHVICQAFRAVEVGRAEVIVGHNTELTLSPEVVSFVDESAIDIATVPITQEQLAQIEAAGFRAIRPASWPPPQVAVQDGILMAGYPSPWRLEVSWHEQDFRATTLGLLVHSVHSTEFVAHRDPAYSNSVSVSLEELPILDLRGCSGGPVFLLRHEPILVPQLCGIVKQGWHVDEGNIIIRFARLDLVQDDGSVRAP